MSVVLTLGNVVFSDFEVPENINSGGEQMLVVHKLPGGSRVIDAMGPDDADIRWSGRFRGSSAEERALMLDSLRRAGKPLLMTYSLHRYQVLIRDFTANFNQSYEIPYSITCTVLLDETQSLLGTVVGFAESLAMDIATATGLTALIGSDNLNASLAAVTAAYSNYQAGAPNVTTAFAGTTAAADDALLGSLQTSLGSAQAAVSANITSVISGLNTSPVLTGGSPASMASALSGAAASFGQLANMYQLSSVLSRMNVNTVNAGS